MSNSELLGDDCMPEYNTEYNAENNMQYVINELTGVCMLPACGEDSLNIESVRQICDTLQNLEWVGIGTTWFVNSTDIANIEVISPGAERSANEKSDSWAVGNYDRDNAYKIHRENDGDPSTVRYGGTTSDRNLISYIDAFRANCKKIAFYPFFAVDNENKDWRGLIKGDSSFLNAFYEKYKPFVMHYANLLKDRVDIFYLGSELEGLTSIKAEGRDFPFVDCLIDLASSVKTVLGAKVEISYAANWSEYHSCEGGYRPLDKLWSNENIGFVGIDYYMPLTNTKSSDISLAEIKQGFTSGEGRDYYKLDDCQISFDSKDAQWKNIEYWYGSEHWAWDAEKEESYKTSWVPSSKRIIFSEFGFPSVDKATNNPHEYDAYPDYSTGETNFSLQIEAIRATIEYISESDFIRQGFCYGWDSRGSGWQEKFGDGNKWEKGHWIDGKLKKRLI